MRAQCDEVKRLLASNENCANMTNDEIKAFIQSVESRMKKKEEIAVLINLKKAYNKEVTIDNYGDICEQMKKVFPDNKVCKEKLPADCYNSALRTELYPAVTICYNALVGAPTSNSGCQHDYIPFLKAVCDQDTAKIKEALNTKAEDINVTNRVGENALHLAIKKDNFVIFNLLVDSNIDTSKKDDNGITPFLLIAEKGNHHLLPTLFHETSLNRVERNKKGQTALHIAIERNNNQVAKFLIENFNTSDIDTGDYDNNTPLHLAAQKNDILTVERLLQKDVNVNALNKDGKSPVDLTTNNQVKELLENAMYH